MAKWRSEPTILASRERISGISVWTEHLCLQAEEGGGYKLFTGHYQSLAHWEDFYDEETGDYTVPDEIDGFEVVGMEGDDIVGGELDYNDEAQAVTFRSHDEEHVRTWLKSTGWYSKVDVVTLRFALWKL